MIIGGWVTGGRNVPRTNTAARGRFGAILTFTLGLAAFTIDEGWSQCREKGEEDKNLWAEMHHWLSLGIAICVYLASHEPLYSHSRNYIAMFLMEMDCDVNPQALPPVFLHT